MKYRYTCDQLGVCQHRYLLCLGCVKPGNVSTVKVKNKKPVAKPAEKKGRA